MNVCSTCVTCKLELSSSLLDHTKYGVMLALWYAYRLVRVALKLNPANSC